MSEAYGALDRTLHKLVFSSAGLRATATDIEESAFAASWAEAPSPRPIFVTSLARAGTTALLNALSRVPCVATHRYRDMPLVCAPVLWSKLSASFRKSTSLAERAHGDGIMVGFDSPEAFEETFWMSARPDKFQGERLSLWRPGDLSADARDDMLRHMRKIISLRNAGPTGRYVSKNNANMMRAPLIQASFPDAQIVLPLRDPVSHAASLFRQHRNFLARHEEDDFTKRYMKDIGHFEFGALHRPFDAPSLDEFVDGRTPSDINYWLAYWIAVYDFVADTSASLGDSIVVVKTADIRADPAQRFGRLCEVLELDPGDQFGEAAQTFKPERTQEQPTVDPILASKASEVFDRLAALVRI
ncbi:MAG: sulfotransferase [Pseudomonadota bacterium]